ncbi:MAG TPA: hypothetical protein PKZ76_05850 [Xanthomonadaceae bacterium]|nr:hypothetical protein [Xanthomonadaceae bacterium]
MSNNSNRSIGYRTSDLAVVLFAFYWILVFGGLVANPFSGPDASSFIRYHLFALLFASLMALLDVGGAPEVTDGLKIDGHKTPIRSLSLRKAMLGALAFVFAVAGLLLVVAAVNWIFGAESPFRVDEPKVAGFLLVVGLAAALGSYFAVRRIRGQMRDSG